MKKLNLLVLALGLILSPTLVLASASEGVINPLYRFAWSDKIGQIDMAGVKVTDTQLKGVAITTGFGLINFDDPSFKVKNDGMGNLSGSAYGTQTGLINFAGVRIGTDGYFSGTADGSFVSGIIYFDCASNSACPGSVSAKVATDWRSATNRQAEVVATTLVQATVTKNYSSCDGLNDYLSYSRCVSEVDSRRLETTALATEEPKAIDGDYSIKINNGELSASKLLVTLNITAAKDAVDMVIAKDNNFGFGGKQKVASTAVWQLDDEEGTPQYVYVKFYDASGAPLKVITTSIILDKRQGDAQAEKEAERAFKLMFGRSSTVSNEDVEAIKIMAYGLSANVARDLVREKAAISRFIKVYKHSPKVTQEWNIVKGYAYAQVIAKKSSTPVVVTDNATPVPSTEIPAENTKDCRLKVKLSANMDMGSRGKEVTALQNTLKCLGVLAEDYKVTGNFDTETELAVSTFQKQNKMLCKNGTYCGVIGPATRDKLNKLPAPKLEVKKTEPKTSKTTKIILTRNLTLDMTGDDVTKLQEFLAKDSELYPEAVVSGKFGPATEEAVKRFQEKNNLKCADGTACGYVGPATRKMLNQAMSE